MANHSTPGRVRVKIRLAAGRVSLSTVDGEETEVNVELLNEVARDLLDDVREEARATGPGEHEVVVEAPERGRRILRLGRDPEFHISVRAPHGAHAVCRAASADLEGDGRFGSLRVKMASGDVEFSGEIEGEASVETASGDVALGTVGGSCDVRTASGNVALGQTGGPVSTRLVSGDLSVGKVLDSFAGETVSGDVELRSVSAGEVRLRSMSGDVEIGVRRGSRVWMDLNSVSGSTTSELDAADGPSDGAEIEIRASSVSGDIRVRRARNTDGHPAARP